MLLAGDVGGTKTNLAIFASKDDLHTPLFQAKLPSSNYPSLSALAQDFLTHVNSPIEKAVFGVAGPVVDGTAKITNLPWVMDEKQLAADLHIPSVILMNDLAVLATAIPLLEPGDVHTLNQGEAAEHGPIAVVAPGTGLGEAFLVWDGSRYRIYPSEGGHADFAPTSSNEIGLLVYMLENLEHVSYEHVCSGIGLPNIYAYLKESAMFDEPDWLREQFIQVDDQTPIIVNNGLDNQHSAPICVATLRMFASILGAEAGNMAIKLLANGGIYIGGGIPPRILSVLESEDFMKSFKNKGRFAPMLAKMPVHVILNPKVPLIGAAAYGFNLL